MRNCLIVDARNGTTTVVHDFLAQRRFDVTAVSTAEEAIDVCRQTMPDVIVYDDSADEHGGTAFLRKVRRCGRGVRPVVLYCSENSDLESLSALIIEGASECLMKPFDDELLEFKLLQSGIKVSDDH